MHRSKSKHKKKNNHQQWIANKKSQRFMCKSAHRNCILFSFNLRFSTLIKQIMRLKILRWWPHSLFPFVAHLLKYTLYVYLNSWIFVCDVLWPWCRLLYIFVCDMVHGWSAIPSLFNIAACDDDVSLLPHRSQQA